MGSDGGVNRGESGGLQSTVSPSVGQDLATKQQPNPTFVDALSIFGKCGSERGGDFVSRFGSVWRHFWMPQLGRGSVGWLVSCKYLVGRGQGC